MNKIKGGTVLPMLDFWVGAGSRGHTSEQDGRPVSQADLDATNRLQETGWQINRAILSIAQSAFDNGHPAIGVNQYDPPVVPRRLREAEFLALDQDGRKAVAKARMEAREAAEVWRSAVSATGAVLEDAWSVVSQPSVYVAYGHDARLRRYPRVSSGPSPQGNGLSRALLRFDTSMTLGPRGLHWLLVRAGTCAGLDKLSHSERAKWANEHTQDMMDAAVNPFGSDWWWKDRDDPWGLLATCFEITDAMLSGNPDAFQSRLPVQVDGTCNGLQHLSALGLDPVGAFATNLTSCEDRQDIYEAVAVVVRAKVQADADAGLEVAKGWVGKIVRDTVKRGCMTTAYGVTRRGMRDQLVADGFTDHLDRKAQSVAGDYLRDIMWDAIGQVVVAARNIMDWLQGVAVILAEANIPFRWTTPMGSVIQQAYRPSAVKTMTTAFGRLKVLGPIDKSSLKVRKQALAAAPNFIHSFDAAHMAKTINAGAAMGITHWSTIHDSYGTHAAKMDCLNRILRETFVAIYKGDWLLEVYDEVVSYAPHLDIPTPPSRGSLDITSVLDSPWFFA